MDTTNIGEYVETRILSLFRILKDQRAAEEKARHIAPSFAAYNDQVSIILQMSETVGKLLEMFHLSDDLKVALSNDVKKLRTECKSLYKDIEDMRKWRT